MSNYAARLRAKKAENAAERCVELCEEMRRECRRHERLHYEKTKQDFDNQHQYLIAQLSSMQEAIITAMRCNSVPRFIEMPK